MNVFLNGISGFFMTAQREGLKLPNTGDNTQLGLAAVIMGVALIVIVFLIISMRKKK